MKRHIKNQHAGLAQMRWIPYNKSLPPELNAAMAAAAPNAYSDTGNETGFSFGFLNARKKQVKAKESDAHSYLDTVMERVKKIAEFKENLTKITGGGQVPQASYSPYYYQVPPVTNQKPEQKLAPVARISAIERTFSSIINSGCRGYVCEKCLTPDLLIFSSNSNSPYRRPHRHVCQQQDVTQGESWEKAKKMSEKVVVDSLIEIIYVGTGGKPTLSTREVDPSSLMKETKVVDFGDVKDDDLIYRAAKEHIIRIADKAELLPFVSKTKATRCTCQFSHNGTRKWYDVVISAEPNAQAVP